MICKKCGFANNNVYQNSPKCDKCGYDDNVFAHA